MRKALIVAVVVVVLIAAGLAAVWLFLRGMAAPRQVSIGEDSYLTVSLSGWLPEDRPADILGGALGGGRLTVRDCLRGLRQAQEDPRIKGLAVRLGPLGIGWAKAEELRRAIAGFVETGKPVVSFLELVTDREYYVASAAAKLCALPSALVLVDGLAAQALFMRGTLDKLGIEPELVQIGRYKGAGETFTRKKMSESLRESLEAILDDRYADLVEVLSSSRSMSAEELMRVLDEGPYSAREAVRVGLVDTLLYFEGIEEMMEEVAGVEELTEVGLRDYVRSNLRTRAPGGPRVALVYAVGQIVLGKSQSSPFGGRALGSQTLVDALRKAKENERIKAVVMRVDSPGGSGLASDAIWQEVRRCAEQKPVVVSMSDVAASGGYYISTGASAIVAEAGTITGSIGVIGGKFNMSGLYGKLGLNKDELARGNHALMFSENRGFTKGERRRFESMLKSFYYDDFLPKVAQGRDISLEQADSVGQGRVWTGRQAREKGLVDELGGLWKAIEVAKEKAGIPEEHEVRLVQYPREKKFLEMLFEKLDLGSVLPHGDALSRCRDWPWKAGEPLTLMPYEIEVE